MGTLADLKNEAAAVVLVIAIIVSVGAGYLGGVASQRAATSVSTTTATTTTTTKVIETETGTVRGLQLLARINPSSVAAGENVSIVSEVYNSLQTNVTISFSEISNPTQAPCGLGISPTGIRVYAGHYTFTNLSEASPLLLYDASQVFFCFRAYDSTYTFLPNSDEARVSYLGTSMVSTANETVTLSGYWTGGPLSGPSSGYLHNGFDPGPYTVVVFDAWGQQLIEHFQVV